MVPEKLKTSGVFKSGYEIQKQHSHLKFLQTILSHMDSAFKYKKISISHSYYLLTHVWSCMEN